jgi:aryl-alcohol dehydrogenase-like predicted oxidoreductase
MQMRKLGNSDLHITPVGYGAWAIGDSAGSSLGDR